MQDQTLSNGHAASPTVPLRTLERHPIEDTRTVDDALIQEITRRIVEGVNPSRVILFGSRARGDYDGDSDVDLFIEMESDEPRWMRRKRVDRLFPRRWWPMDLYILTPEEIRTWEGSLATILPTIKQEGKVLYERPNT